MLDSSRAVAANGVGRIYVTNSKGSVTVYAAGANGNAAPIAILQGARTGLEVPAGVAIAP